MPALWEQPQRGAAALSQDRVPLAHPGHGLHLNGLSTGSKAVLPEDDNMVVWAARGNGESGARVQPAPRVGAALGAATWGTQGKPPWGQLGRKPWAAQAFGADPGAAQRCPARSEPLALPVARVWAPGITPYSKLQWAAVTTQYWLIKEPPQKWDPVRVWGGKREGEMGLGGLNTPKLGTEVPLVPRRGTELAMAVLGAVPRDGVVPAGTPARARSRARRSAR